MQIDPADVLAPSIAAELARGWIDADAVAKAMQSVDDSMFYREANRRLYRAMRRLFERGELSEETYRVVVAGLGLDPDTLTLLIYQIVAWEDPRADVQRAQPTTQQETIKTLDALGFDTGLLEQRDVAEYAFAYRQAHEGEDPLPRPKGMERVFEINRNFRNEGIDPSHLPDFTMLEYYAAYWNYLDNMAFTESLIKAAVQETIGGLQFTYQGTAIDLDGPWEKKSFRELILQDCGIDLVAANDKASLVAAIDANGITIDRATFYRKIDELGILPTTSQPSAGEFEQFFRQASAGSDGIVAVLVSSKLSGTVASARMASRFGPSSIASRPMSR